VRRGSSRTPHNHEYMLRCNRMQAPKLMARLGVSRSSGHRRRSSNPHLGCGPFRCCRRPQGDLWRIKKRGRPDDERPKSREETPKVGYDRQA
jgi:hypothetical protein